MDACNAELNIIQMVDIYIYGEKGKAAPLIVMNTFQGNGSDVYSALCTMTEKELTGSIISAIKAELGAEPEYTAIAGYSLGGLFAIYSLYRTDVFSRAVSASGSMWYPSFLEYAEKNNFGKMPSRVYFPLGDREARTRNALLSTVEDKTGKVYDQYKNKGIETTFEMNPGNHFKDADLRLAKGIAWILK